MSYEDFLERYNAVQHTYLEAKDKGLGHRDEDLLVLDVLKACVEGAPNCTVMAMLMVQLAEDERIDRWYS